MGFLGLVFCQLVCCDYNLHFVKKSYVPICWEIEDKMLIVVDLFGLKRQQGFKTYIV
jgi:hypothetical protein